MTRANEMGHVDEEGGIVEHVVGVAFQQKNH